MNRHVVEIIVVRLRAITQRKTSRTRTTTHPKVKCIGELQFPQRERQRERERKRLREPERGRERERSSHEHQSCFHTPTQCRCQAAIAISTRTSCCHGGGGPAAPRQEESSHGDHWCYWPRPTPVVCSATPAIHLRATHTQ